MAKKEQSVDMPHQVLDPRRDFYGYPAGLGQTYENFYGADAFHAAGKRLRLRVFRLICSNVLVQWPFCS